MLFYILCTAEQIEALTQYTHWTALPGRDCSHCPMGGGGDIPNKYPCETKAAGHAYTRVYVHIDNRGAHAPRRRKLERLHDAATSIHVYDTKHAIHTTFALHLYLHIMFLCNVLAFISDLEIVNTCVD